ncbi:putative cysteine desulfurase IscS 1 [Pullulanibacillus camelliae]|uniref:cysteine desulfurase n=1 Tax=Pullulanibacillus camelliae TaxID=1707096 RepID=A0A8J2YHE0_9BACL|nr:cysteine desulfurase family protein [Pullulanibacillus camelliae]GGE42986.1 putative cysteine desulfurase IscS 1 [Pullulanibacillus camelliae]
MEHIYLDHAATTPVHPKVVEAMRPIFEEVYGNPSSIHYHGREARKIIDDARSDIARMIGANAKDIVFTSGGTEADNMAIMGTAFAQKEKGRHIITTKVEHHAVLNTCKFLEKQGFDVTYLDVDQTGRLAVEDVKAALRKDTILVTVMTANNEVGTLQPIEEIGALLEGTGIVFHTDAVQAFGTMAMDVDALKVDLLSMTAHKINGPKGIGFLYVREAVPLLPYQHGGEQERKRRGGTHNVPGIVGLQHALVLAVQGREEKVEQYHRLRQVLIDALTDANVQFSINGSTEHTLASLINVHFPGVNVESLLTALDLNGVSVSSGSACTAGSVEPSHVLTALYGAESEQAKSSIRISFGLYNTEDQVLKAAEIIAKTVQRMGIA